MNKSLSTMVQKNPYYARKYHVWCIKTIFYILTTIFLSFLPTNCLAILKANPRKKRTGLFKDSSILGEKAVLTIAFSDGR